MSYDPTLNHHRASRSLHTDSPTPQTDSWDNTPQQSHYTTHSIPSGNQSEHHLSSQSPDTPTNAPQQIPFITPTDETHEGVAPLKSLPSFDQDAEAFRHDNVMRTVYENTQNAMEWLFGDAEWMWEKALNSKERSMPESERCSEAWRISMWGHLRDDRLTGRPEAVKGYPQDKLGKPYNLMFDALERDARIIERRIDPLERHFEVKYKPRLQVRSTATTIDFKARLNVAWEEDDWPEDPNGERITYTRIFSGPRRVVRGVWTDARETSHGTRGLIWRLSGDKDDDWKLTTRRNEPLNELSSSSVN